MLTDGKRSPTARKHTVGKTEENQRKTELNANEWVHSIDLKVVFHKLLSKSFYLLPEAITGSNLHAGKKNRKDETFSIQKAIMPYPLDIMFASTTTLNVGSRENNSRVFIVLAWKILRRFMWIIWTYITHQIYCMWNALPLAQFLSIGRIKTQSWSWATSLQEWMTREASPCTYSRST